jgi:3-methyladenine DNA glycosylase AlkD
VKGVKRKKFTKTKLKPLSKLDTAKQPNERKMMSHVQG